ncbi:BLUF domain-containing protein [Herbiconiux sp. CPCC 205716]|uniref:BLUF domain-containing protein n=1 Tax=Herbiconiux gentiana TaxID=2970912 RepID=A0ABT2GLL9_9MICO|nr:BLUF domain-containing protein [Herbiconiux gentiana]MCS5716175.1 BLUF domain-containing protein [Herbiconiux gentiana]
MGTEQDDVLSIIYSSSATVPFSDDDLVELLKVSRHNNAGSEVTGMLLYRDGRFLQVLEGPEPSVRRRMEVIAGDSRHVDVLVLLEEGLNERRFPDWTMGFVPHEATPPDDIPGYLSAFGLADDDEDSREAARALAELMAWFEDTAKRSV